MANLPPARGGGCLASFWPVVAAFALALAAAVCFYYTLLLFGTLDLPHWLGLNVLLLLFILVYVALTLFCSVVAKSQAAAGGLALFFLFILGLAGTIPGLGDYLPGHLLVWGRELMMGGSNPAWPALGIGLALISRHQNQGRDGPCAQREHWQRWFW